MANDIIINKLIECDSILAIALGGSRSRGEEKENSDIDLFCIVKNECFDEFRADFRSFLERISCIQYAAEVFYLEHWGYLYKALAITGIDYDISLISENRINEMSIRSTNKVLKDNNGILLKWIAEANDDDYKIEKLECQRRLDYATLFGIERKRFCEAREKGDYWYGVRCLERMKNYLIRCDRIQNGNFPKSRSCPEKNYLDLGDFIRKEYILDGTMDTASKTSENLCRIFNKIIMDEELKERGQLKCKKRDSF